MVVLAAVCSIGHSSGVGVHEAVAPAPVVTAASSQYFERTFNRLVAAQPVFEPVIPVAQTPPVVVEPVTKNVPVPVHPTQSLPPPNVAIAVATAHAAAPVATILLPPYPFGLPPSIGFIPAPPINVPDEERPRESTTKPSTKATTREPEPTTPLPSPSNTDNSFAQPLPSNQHNNFNQYYAPPVQLPVTKPQKLKTSVEVVPVPLQYIAPPPMLHHHHHHHHHGVKPVKIVHAFVPRAKIIIRPVSSPLRIRRVRIPVRLVAYRPVNARNGARRFPQNVRLRTNAREAEPTTFRPLNRPITKPPRI